MHACHAAVVEDRRRQAAMNAEVAYQQAETRRVERGTTTAMWQAIMLFTAAGEFSQHTSLLLTGFRHVLYSKGSSKSNRCMRIILDYACCTVAALKHCAVYSMVIDGCQLGLPELRRLAVVLDMLPCTCITHTLQAMREVQQSCRVLLPYRSVCRCHGSHARLLASSAAKCWQVACAQ